jgi:diguanylate cyclase (GGDEF)-like protein
MAQNLERRRALLAAEDRPRDELRELFGADPLKGWDASEAGSVEQARFCLQMTPCDVLVLDGSLYRPEETDNVSWLASQRHAPVVFLAEPDADVVLRALRNGANHWLPRSLALNHPQVLAAKLDHAAELGELRRQARSVSEALVDCRQQVGRLVGLLWDALSAPGQPPWLTQRNVLERLQEEVARSARHGDPLTVVLGELQAGRRDHLSADESQQLAAWSAQQLSRAKRRCDVAGQYGPHGFLLVLPHTSGPEAVQFCRRLRNLLEHVQAGKGGPLSPLNACFGIASFGPSATTPKGLLSRAEERLEQAKTGIGERIEI